MTSISCANSILQFRLLRIVEILVFANLREFFTQVVILDEHLRNALFVK